MRRWQLLLLLYLMFDFAHPWTPGVFFFEGDQLFVDGIVTLGKATPPRPAPAHEPHGILRLNDPDRGMRQAWRHRDDSSRRFTPRTEKRYSARSRRRPSPPSSPDAH